jgi:hypothetical protein
MSAWLDTSAPWPAGHIDGLSDGVLDYPIAFRALVLDDAPDSYSGSGTIFVDDLYSEKANLPAPAAASSPAATSGGLSVSFRADETRIGAGSCTRLHWDVENAREVYLNGVGVVGHGEREVCPTGTTTYRLRVVRLDGAADVHRIMIEVVSP